MRTQSTSTYCVHLFIYQNLPRNTNKILNKALFTVNLDDGGRTKIINIGIMLYGAHPRVANSTSPSNTFYFVKSLCMPHFSIGVGISMLTFARLAN